MILKGLLRRRARTFLTVGGIAIAVAAVIALGALAEGFLQGYGDMALGSGADLLVTQKDAIDLVFSAVDEDLKPILQSFPGVAAVGEMVYAFAATDKVPYLVVYGYEPEGFAVQRFKVVQGEPLSTRSYGRGGRPLLLGRAAASNLGKSVGDTFRLYESTFRIVGIYETGKPFEDGGAVISLKDAQGITGKPRQVNALLIKLKPDADIDQLKSRIEMRYPRVIVTRSAEFLNQQDLLKSFAAFTWGVSFIALLIGGAGVMNTMLMSVFERTREFGVLRAVGWSSRRVLGLVLRESAMLSAFGGAVGIGLGLGLLHLSRQDPQLGTLVPQKLSPLLFGQAIGIAVGLGVIGGALPAWRASRLQPVEALSAEGGTVMAVRHATLPAMRTLLRQPVRSLLTIVGLGIAMMAMVLLGALGDGVVDAMDGMTGGAGAHLVGIEAKASVDLSKISEDDVRRIAAMPAVKPAEGFLTGYTAVSDVPFFIVFGYQPRGAGIQGFPIVEGQPLVTNQQIILGRVAAQNLKKRVGQNLRLFDRSFTIVGIYETGVPFQDGGGVLSLRDAQRLFGQPRMVSFVGVWLHDPQQAEAVIAEVEARFPTIDLAPSAEFGESLTDTQMMRASTWAIAAVTLVVGGLGVANTMVMSVYERTREIGVLRALGWSRMRVLWMTVQESLSLSLLGGAAGTLVGVLLGLLLNLNPLMLGMFRMTYTPGLFLQAMGTVLVLGTLGGLYPAWRASQLSPVEALRYE